MPGRTERLRQVYPAAHRRRTDEADSGRRFAQPGATIRYLPQEPDFSEFTTTLAYVEGGFDEKMPPVTGTARRICWNNSD